MDAFCHKNIHIGTACIGLLHNGGMRSAMIHPLAKRLARTCNSLHAAGLSPARSGNVSARDGNLLWITPKGYSMKEVMPERLVMIWPGNRVVSDAGLEPSSELPMHQAIYEAHPGVRAVVHTHAPHATALAVAHQDLTEPLMSEILQTIGEVPLVAFQAPGSPELGEAVATALKGHQAVLLANHGVVAVGGSLEEAYYNLELVENYARISILSRSLGAHALTMEQIGIMAALQPPS